MTEKRTDGAWEWVPNDAVVVYSKQTVQEKLGHTNSGSTRKQLSRYDIPAITGYEAAQVDWMIEVIDPERTTWDRRPKPVEKPAVTKARNPRVRRTA